MGTMSDDRFTDPDRDRTAWANARHRMIKKTYQTIEKRVPSYPIGVEILMRMIHEGKTKDRPFHFARARFISLSDDLLWEAYEWWLEGKEHPDLARVVKKAS